MSSKRVIDRLRERYGGLWHYDPGMREWQCSDGSIAYCVSEFNPRYDGDDDTFTHKLMIRNPGSLEREALRGRLVDWSLE
jgi:hypothetical protein